MARTSKKINVLNKFYIITNGKSSEQNYFNLLKSKKSIYDVKVIFQNNDPVGLVEYAVNLKDANQIWLVFDIDYTYKENRLIKAITKAKKYGIKYAFSNLAFEVWLISHFQKCYQELDINGHKKILDNYLNKQKIGLTYSKANIDILKKYFIPNYHNAVINAKIVHQEWIKKNNKKYGNNANQKIWEWNSCTTIYKLIEAMKLNKL